MRSGEMKRQNGSPDEADRGADPSRTSAAPSGRPQRQLLWSMKQTEPWPAASSPTCELFTIFRSAGCRGPLNQSNPPRALSPTSVLSSSAVVLACAAHDEARQSVLWPLWHG
jgi:hypothetical protein